MIAANKCKYYHVRLHKGNVYNSDACLSLPITHLLQPPCPKHPQHSVFPATTLHRKCQPSQLPLQERPLPLPPPRLPPKPLLRPRPRRPLRLPLALTARPRRRGERPGRRLTPPTSTRVRVFDSNRHQFSASNPQLSSSQAGPSRHGYLEQGNGHLELVRQRYL